MRRDACKITANTLEMDVIRKIASGAAIGTAAKRTSAFAMTPVFGKRTNKQCSIIAWTIEHRTTAISEPPEKSLLQIKRDVGGFVASHCYVSKVLYE